MKLTKRELAVMRILWKAEKPLMVSEIVQRDKDGTIYSVQRIIHNLMKKNMVDVDGIAYNKKALGRTFKPLVNSEIIELNAIQELFDSLVSKNITKSNLIAALLPRDNDAKTLNELNNLEEIIRERKKQILESGAANGPQKG